MTAWLRLARVALAPTIVWDVLVGAWLAGIAVDGRLALPGGVLLLVYHAGMILNDVADRGIDAEHRPGRPLPSGAVGTRSAALAAFAMLAAANALAWLNLPENAAYLTLGLTVIVLVYDFGGPSLRTGAGPPLLALARIGSLSLPSLSFAIEREAWGAGVLHPTFMYGMWILFTSRVAAYEEDGTPGIRGLQYAIGIAASPVVLTLGGGIHWAFFPAWIAVGAWVLYPAFRDHKIFWAPERVQEATRLALSTAPLGLGLALLSKGLLWQAPFALLVSVAVRFIARRFPPE